MHVPPSPQVWQLPQLRINSPEMEHDPPRGLRFRALFTNTLKRVSEEERKLEEVASRKGRNLTSRLFPQTLLPWGKLLCLDGLNLCAKQH